MSLDRNSMDHHMKLVFVILSVLFTILTGILCSVLTGYRKRQKVYLESQRRQHQEIFAAFEEQRGRRRRRRRQSEDYDEEDDDEDYETENDNDDSAEAMWYRLKRIQKALKFETLSLPSPPLEAVREERIISQDIESANDIVDVRSKSLDSCQSHNNNEEDNNDAEKKVVASPPSRYLKRKSSSSSPSDGDNIIVASFFGLFMSSWWRKNDENVCCVCLEPYRENQMICSPKCSDCNHVFHEHCAIPWFQKHDECPMCRTNILAAFSVEAEDEHPKEGSGESSSSALALV